MTNYNGADGLVLCVISGKIDVEKWISSIDMLDHIKNVEALQSLYQRLSKACDWCNISVN